METSDAEDNQNEHEGAQNPFVDIQVDDGDINVGRMHVRGSIRALQRELENLPNLPGRSTIIVNHVYNYHYQSDRPSEQHMQDVASYGEEYTGYLKRRCLKICEAPTKLCVDLPQEATWPPLKVVEYFDGKTGISRGCKYVPDPKYRKNKCREYQGQAISLKQLHQHVHAEQCLHAALIGNLGCGKTELCKEYAKMVLNREVPELSDIEMVHYIAANDLPSCNETDLPVRELLFDRFLCEYVEPKTSRYGYEYFCRYPNKMLLIFDGAEQLLTACEDSVEPINCYSKTTLRKLLQNILMRQIFPGCRTLLTARDWAFRDLTGSCRPLTFILVGSLTTEQRTSLSASVDLPDQLWKFPAAFHLARDQLFLYFAVSSLRSGCGDDNARITTDVMLVLAMLQCLIRSSNSAREFGNNMAKFKVIAFDMIKSGVLRRSYGELEKYCKESCVDTAVYRTMRDLMVVAPQHQHPIFYRLLNNDYSYFFANQVLQEVLAALHIGEMPCTVFVEFVDTLLHTQKWFVVRRFLCGMMLHQDIRDNCRNCMSVHADFPEKETKLLSSLEEQAKKIENMPSYEKLELLATLHESGQVARSIIERHIQSLTLPGINLEPSDLFVLLQTENSIRNLKEIDVSFDKSVSTEEYDRFVSLFIKKGEKIRLNLSHLHLTLRHVKGIEAPIASIINTRHQHRRDICIVAKMGTPPILLREFEKIHNVSPQLCTIRVEEIVVTEDSAAAD